jgi:four helix bundle protein
MRDHTRLRAFELADELAVAVYRATQNFPREEQFGLTSQMRRCAVSVASNIVEGCARHSEADYVRFLDIAYGSVRELEYQISLATRLGFIPSQVGDEVASRAAETAKVLNGLIRSLRQQ